jgi:hypothetical protein
LIICLGNFFERIFSYYQLFIQTIVIIIGAITLTNLAGISFLLILMSSNDISDFIETVANLLISSIEVLFSAIIELYLSSAFVIGAITVTSLGGISFLLILMNFNDISDFLETVGNLLISSIEELWLAIIELG